MVVELKPDFDERPFIVIWETTQACDLACVHCRAFAQPLRSALELSTAEGKRVIDEVAALKAPVTIATDARPRYAGRHRTRSARNQRRQRVRIISHLGEVFPSGFLPVFAGNVRKQSLTELYGILHFSFRCGIVPTSKASVVCANFAKFAAAREREPTH